MDVVEADDQRRPVWTANVLAAYQWLAILASLFVWPMALFNRRWPPVFEPTRVATYWLSFAAILFGLFAFRKAEASTLRIACVVGIAIAFVCNASTVIVGSIYDRSNPVLPLLLVAAVIVLGRWHCRRLRRQAN